LRSPLHTLFVVIVCILSLYALMGILVAAVIF
jgi:hypothetical protein